MFISNSLSSADLVISVLYFVTSEEPSEERLDLISICRYTPSGLASAKEIA
jgi:hypothetical protein